MLATRNLSLTLLRCRLVTPRHRPLPVPVTVLVGALLAVSLAGSGGADSAPALLQRAHDLRAANTALAARTHAALLQLYALDSRLARAQARLDALTAQAEAVRRERVLTAKRLRIAQRDAAAAAAAIASTRAQQAGYLGSLRAKERLNGVRISSLERAARAAQAKSAVLVPAASAAPAAAGAQTLSVVATGYSGTGATATGLAAGWGVVAVDPSVIPLGTRMSIPGYGAGVAADVGPAVS